jgi:hypothetical protein
MVETLTGTKFAGTTDKPRWQGTTITTAFKTQARGTLTREQQRFTTRFVLRCAKWLVYCRTPARMRSGMRSHRSR